jgi:hypothetical protein
MNWLIVVGIYVVCCVLSYLFMRRDFRKNDLGWSNKDRISGVLFSLLGPVMLIVGIIINLQTYILKKFKNYWEKPAKW